MRVIIPEGEAKRDGCVESVGRARAGRSCRSHNDGRSIAAAGESIDAGAGCLFWLCS